MAIAMAVVARQAIGLWEEILMTTKRTHSKKLSLSKETVRILSKEQLLQIAGGGPTALDCSVTCTK